ncbi:MAG: calcium/sodium antiporter [Acholeplasmataceae bacterium]
MTLFLNIIGLLIGFVFLIKGADLFVDSSSSIAKKLKVPTLIIGLTLVSFGTSLPELAVSFTASLAAKAAGTTADIAMGNIIGSNIANLTLILGASAILMPVAIKRSLVKREFPFLILVTVLIALFGILFQQNLVISQWEAVILLIFFVIYMYMMIKSDKEIIAVEEIQIINTKKAIILLIIGIAGVTLGGMLVTNSAEYLSIKILTESFGVSISNAQSFIGLSVVALGTSLPELVTSMVAAKKGESDIAIGNVIGSNVFNTIFIVGLAGIVSPLGISSGVAIDLFIALGITLVVFIISFVKNKISKLSGVLLLVIYFSYITYIVLRTFGIL